MLISWAKYYSRENPGGCGYIRQNTTPPRSTQRVLRQGGGTIQQLVTVTDRCPRAHAQRE